MKNESDILVLYCIPQAFPIHEKELTMRLLKTGFEEFFQIKFDASMLRRGKYGKPFYGRDDQVQFNISHCKRGAVAAFSRCPVGIDVESTRKVHARTVRKSCCQEEISYVLGACGQKMEGGALLSESQTRRFLHLWTLKESYVKMTGEGMRRSFDEVNFMIPLKESLMAKKVFSVEGRDPDSCCFLCLPGEVTIALTARQREGEKDFKVAWNEMYE